MNIKWQEESRLNASVLTLRLKLKSQKLARNTCIGALDSVHSKFRNELSFSLRFRRQQFWIMRSVFFFERQCKDHVTCQTQITAIVKNHRTSKLFQCSRIFFKSGKFDESTFQLRSRHSFFVFVWNLPKPIKASFKYCAILR